MNDKFKPEVEAKRREDKLLDLHRSMRRSSYVLSSGQPSDEYTDFDGFYLGGEGDFEFDRVRAQVRLKDMVGEIIPKIAEAARANAVSRLAFPEKRDDGPVGTLAMMDLILFHSGLEGCIVRPDRRLLAARIKGRPISLGERIMIVSDVATLGGTIARPAACLRELGAVVPAAYVLLDRCQGAKERLAEEGIALLHHWSLAERDKILSDRIGEEAIH